MFLEQEMKGSTCLDRQTSSNGWFGREYQLGNGEEIENKARMARDG